MNSSGSNQTNNNDIPLDQEPGPNSALESIGKIGWSLVLIGILVVGGLLAYILGNTGPTAQRTKKEDTRPTHVEVTQVNEASNEVHLEGYGSVEAARRIKLVPQVSGKIVDRSDSFRPGGFFDEGDTILQIERDDYRLKMLQRKSELQQAKSDLTLAQSNQAVAREEYKRIRDQLDIKNPSVVLKVPQVKSAKASVQKARSALEMARLNLARTSIEAPFDAHVTERNVEIGMNVSIGQTLATLVGTNEYWVKLSLPVSHLRWLMDENGNLKKNLSVRIYNQTAWSDTTYRNAYVKDLIRELESKGRMAQVLVAIEDPLALEPGKKGKPPMMVGSYVKGVIEADTLPNSVKIDRDLLHDGHKIWVATSDGRLDIRDVTVAFRGKENAIITNGLSSRDQVIHTDLSSPVDGMPVHVRNYDNQKADAKQTPKEQTSKKIDPSDSKHSAKRVKDT